MPRTSPSSARHASAETVRGCAGAVGGVADEDRAGARAYLHAGDPVDAEAAARPALAARRRLPGHGRHLGRHDHRPGSPDADAR